MPITALTELETVEVSLVPQGANLKKRFPILKKNEGTNMSDILHAVIDAETSDDSQFANVAKSADLSEEAQAAIVGAMKILNAYSDVVPAQDAVGLLSKGLGVEAPAAPVAKEDDEEESEKGEHKDEDEEVKTLAEMMDDDKKEKGAHEDDEDEDEVKKPGHYEEKMDHEDKVKKSLEGLDPEVAAQVEALWKSQKEAVAKADALQKSLNKERDERLRKEFVAKAEKELRFVPGKSPEELGVLLKTLHSMDSQIATDIENIFKAASSLIEKADLLDELGSSMTGAVSNASAYHQLDALAKSKVSNSGESYAQAFTQAMKENPNLYSAYLNEQNAK